MNQIKFFSTSLFEKIVLWSLICIAFATFVIYFNFSFTRYFQADDFPYLIESSDSLSIVLSPQSNVHFRPIERIHLALVHIFGINPIFFNLLTLLLQILATLAMYFALKEIYNIKIATYSALLFFIIFSYNEILFWIAQAQIIYCLIFVFMAMYFHKKEKIILSFIFMILASFSYSLWYVLPVYFLFSGKSKKMFFLSCMVVGLHILLMIYFSLPLQYYGPVKDFTEIPTRIIICLFNTIFPFTTIDTGITTLTLFILLVILSIYFFAKEQAFSTPVLIFYFVPATIYLLSSHIPSRFFYFPAVAIAIALVIFFLSSRKPYKYIGGIIILYLALISPILNYQDGIDYKNYSLEYKKIIRQSNEIRKLKIGDHAVLINRMPESIPQNYILKNLLVGRLKLFFNRKDSIAGLIYPKDLVNFILLENNLKSIPLNTQALPKDNSIKIEIGDQTTVSNYVFQVVKK
jgi:hypothetical protein